MKNIVSNILGILILASGVYSLIMLELELISFSVLVLVGCGLFYFENDTIKKHLEAGVNKLLNK